jgi:hypothetical protein
MGATNVTAFLNHLAEEESVAAGKQNQVLNAISFYTPRFSAWSLGIWAVQARQNDWVGDLFFRVFGVFRGHSFLSTKKRTAENAYYAEAGNSPKQVFQWLVNSRHGLRRWSKTPEGWPVYRRADEPPFSFLFFSPDASGLKNKKKGMTIGGGFSIHGPPRTGFERGRLEPSLPRDPLTSGCHYVNHILLLGQQEMRNGL